MAILGFFLFKSNCITLVLFYLGQNRGWKDGSVLKITGFSVHDNGLCFISSSFNTKFESIAFSL